MIDPFGDGASLGVRQRRRHDGGVQSAGQFGDQPPLTGRRPHRLDDLIADMVVGRPRPASPIGVCGTPNLYDRG